MHQGTAYLIGQAYVDLLSNVLSLSIADCPINLNQYWKLIAIREDQIAYVAGLNPADDRWTFPLPDQVVAFALLNNKVIEPTVSLQLSLDFDISNGNISFYVDPTNPSGSGTPINGYARRVVSVAVGGRMSDSLVMDWTTTPVRKGDIVRLIYVSPNGQNSKISDQPIVLVRPDGLYVSEGTPLPAASIAVKYVVLRNTASSPSILEPLTFVGNVATLLHGRVISGTALVYAKRMSDGEDVQEGVDYTIDYEAGVLTRLSTWTASSVNKIDYAWLLAVWPLAGPDPRKSLTGVITNTVSTLVAEMTLWAPDVKIDKMLLAKNFGPFIGLSAPSSESYRAFIRGIFQLYILGPVLERFESAFNVVLGLPVIRDDGEILTGFETPNVDHPDDNRVITLRAGFSATYDYPISVPLRTDIQDSTNFNVLTFNSFETLTLAVQVTDYIQDPDWWHNIVIPVELFDAGSNGTPVPTASRRTATNQLVSHIAGAEDGPQAGDPGLYAGADDDRFIPPPISMGNPHPIFRHRVGFTLMDRFLKRHMFYIAFDTSVFSLPDAFTTDPNELQRLIVDSRPAHTFAYVQPSTFFEDDGTFYDDNSQWYQSQAGGADPSLPEIYSNPADAPLATPVPSQLGLFLSPGILFETDDVIDTDETYEAGVNAWLSGDFYHYELLHNTGVNVGTLPIGTPIVIPSVSSPRRLRIVRVWLAATVGGRQVTESVDYVVNYDTNSITRLTVWDLLTFDVTILYLSIGNISTSSIDITVGDRPAQAGEIDAALVRADYGGPSPAAADQLSFVERALTIVVM